MIWMFLYVMKVCVPNGTQDSDSGAPLTCGACRCMTTMLAGQTQRAQSATIEQCLEDTDFFQGTWSMFLIAT